jgi:hypothetical protein
MTIQRRHRFNVRQRLQPPSLWTLTMAILGLVAVIAAIPIAARSSTWNWLFPAAAKPDAVNVQPVGK